MESFTTHRVPCWGVIKYVTTHTVTGGGVMNLLQLLQ